MITNGYLNTDVQKAFVDGIPGCTKHHLKLLSILRDALKKHKSLSVCWLDLANAFSSVFHYLIRFSPAHYHAPPPLIGIISSLYDSLTAVISTESWITDPIHLQTGVYQGDLLSVLMFTTVMNTLADSIVQCYPDLGYALGSSPKKTNMLQYADDTSIIANGPASCQKMFSATKSWLSWSGMNANVPKCVCLSIQSSTGRPYNPNLLLNNKPIPYIADSTFCFLGAPVAVYSTDAESRDHLIAKLSSLLQKVDAIPITRQQKLKILKAGICLTSHGTSPSPPSLSLGSRPSCNQLPPGTLRDGVVSPKQPIPTISSYPRSMVVWTFHTSSLCTRSFRQVKQQIMYAPRTLLSDLLLLCNE